MDSMKAIEPSNPRYADLYSKAAVILKTEDTSINGTQLQTYVPKLQRRLHINFATAVLLIKEIKKMESLNDAH